MSEAVQSPIDRKLTVAKVDLWVPIALLLGMALAVGIAHLVCRGLRAAWPQPDSAMPRRDAPEVRSTEFPPAAPLSVRQRFERDEYLHRQHELLTTYGWVDEGQGLARIPVQRAMHMLADEQRNER